MKIILTLIGLALCITEKVWQYPQELDLLKENNKVYTFSEKKGNGKLNINTIALNTLKFNNIILNFGKSNNSLEYCLLLNRRKQKAIMLF